MNVRLLIVDDNPSVLRTLAFFLHLAGYSVRTCTDSREALRLAESRQYHIVIADVTMPGLDGVELLRRIKAFGPFIQVIMISAFASVARCVECLELGANDFVQKPLGDLNTLREVIDNSVRKLERWHDLLAGVRSAAF